MELRHNSHPPKRSLSPAHSSLMLACQQEDKEDVRSILDRQVRKAYTTTQPVAAQQRDRTGKNALHYCAENVNVECAGRVLSAAPALLDAPDEEGYTPLHLAVISGNRAMVKYLLAKGADARAVDSEKHSCVHWATVSGDPECLDLLISTGHADPSTPDMHGAFPVHYAAQMCGPNTEMGSDVRAGMAVLLKLIENGVDVGCVDRDGRTPLLWAASGETRASKTYCPSGSSDAILALVKAGADVNAVDQDGLTALHCAASRGHVDCLETLITMSGAEVDKVDDSGCSALFYAVTLGHADCTNLLLNFGSQGNRQDKKGRTPAHCGAAKGQLETLKILAHHKANLWLRNAKGDMPLHEAVQSGRKDLVEWLLKQHQGSVNVSNTNGRTPLHIAAITNNVDMCKVLMDYGAFINPIMKNSKNQHLTPLDAALHRGNRGCAKYLNLHGALPASKLLEKREYNRFTENHLSQAVEMSPRTKWRLLRDSSVQTEPHMKDVDTQARLPQKSVSATADLSRNNSPVELKNPCTGKSIRCNAVEGSGKPIIAKVYVHTNKRSKIRRTTRKQTAYRRDFQGEKLLTSDQKRQSVNFQRSENGASNNQVDSMTSRQTDYEKDVPSRKASEPVLFEEPFQPVVEETIPSELVELSAPIYPTVEEPTYQQCDCYSDHQAETAACDCTCHNDDDRTISERRRSSLRTNKESDLENHSPLSSIRSLESTIKDSGFSDDVSRGGQQMSSSDEDRHSDTEEGKYGRRRRRKSRHVARYIVSSGAADTFRLEEDDEEDSEVVAKPRSSSLPQMKKREEHFEVCPRLLNRPTLTKEVQRSLKKYQMERRLFYELQELKRKQITSSPFEEKEVVQKMVERFRNHVLSPYMTDFEGPFTFRAFEKYLYEQLRKLSMGGKIPKPKSITKERTYMSTSLRKPSQVDQIFCVCGSRKCHHKGHIQDSDLTLTRLEDSDVPTLPDITSNTPHPARDHPISKNRSKSWDRLDDSQKTDSTFGTYPGKLGDGNTSSSLPSLNNNPFPRRVPAALLAAINERLGPNVHPEDTIVVEMSTENISSKMRHAFTVQELQEVVSRYEEQVGRKVKPIPLETVLDPEDDGPITFEIRHGKERNIFKLPAGKLKDNKKWFLHYCLWPVGRYFLSPLDQQRLMSIEDIQWEEVRLSPRATLMLPPNFWT